MGIAKIKGPMSNAYYYCQLMLLWWKSIGPTIYFKSSNSFSNFPTVQPLNKKYVKKTPFSLTGVYMVPSVLQRGNWAIKLDLAHGKVE